MEPDRHGGEIEIPAAIPSFCRKESSSPAILGLKENKPQQGAEMSGNCGKLESFSAFGLVANSAVRFLSNRELLENC
jgi:hypothetical protein